MSLWVASLYLLITFRDRVSLFSQNQAIAQNLPQPYLCTVEITNVKEYECNKEIPYIYTIICRECRGNGYGAPCKRGD